MSAALSARGIMQEAIQTKAAAGILGISTRTLQLMAARGEIPGAALIGRRWTFNEAALRRWRRSREIPCRETSTGEARSGGAESNPTAESIAEACEQFLGLRQSKGSRLGAKS